MGEFIGWLIILTFFLAGLLVVGGIIHAIRWILRGIVGGSHR